MLRCEADQEQDAYRVANQLRMASRRALEWIGMFEGLTGFR